MKYIFQFCRILIFCFLGELLHSLLPFPFPSSIYGLILLLLALKAGIVKPESVRETGMFLTGILPLLFIPAAVGVMEVWDELLAMLLPVILALFVVTVLVMAVSGCVTEYIIGRKKEARHD